MNLYWNKVMPIVVANYDWSEEYCKLRTQKAWKAFLKKKIRKMDTKEFDLFLSTMVMESAKKLIMGFDLTEKVEMYRELRGKS